MCSICTFVVQSTMVSGRSVRGSAAKATTTSLARARSCWSAKTAPAVVSRTASAASVVVNRVMRASSLASSHPELGIEHVAQPVADQVDAERGEGQRGAREGGQPPRHVEIVAALREHAAPRGRGRLHPEAEERDGGLGHDELGELKA